MLLGTLSSTPKVLLLNGIWTAISDRISALRSAKLKVGLGQQKGRR